MPNGNIGIKMMNVCTLWKAWNSYELYSLYKMYEQNAIFNGRKKLIQTLFISLSIPQKQWHTFN